MWVKLSSLRGIGSSATKSPIEIIIQLIFWGKRLKSPATDQKRWNLFHRIELWRLSRYTFFLFYQMPNYD
jgi:hypothetical protein